jgi:general secretion pathway protein D
MYNAYALPLDPFEVRQAPIAEFIDWVSKQSGENIILGRGVEGTVSVHVKTMDSKDVIPLFIQVMNSNGYMVDLDKNGFYKVLIDKDKTVKPAQIFTKVYKLNYLRNTKAREIFNSVLLAASNDNRDTQIQETDEKPIATIAVSTHSVDVLPASNALLVSGTENQIKIMDRFVSEIDTDIKQVLIEAVIMETDIGGSESIGINLSNAVRESGLNLISNTINSVSSLTGIAEGGHVVFSKDSDIRALISAIARNSHSKILSTPNIVVLDREKGHISVGQNVPFLTSREVTDGGNTIQQIERKDVGITLSVSPHVLESGQVVLQINQESSSVTNSSLAADIITNKRSISTVAQVRDGETIALGGLVSDETRTVESGIPGLRHIPWLGRLFRYDSEETVQRELTVMIKTLIL